MSDSDILNSQLVIFNLVPSFWNGIVGAGSLTTFTNLFNLNNTNLRFTPDYFKLEEITVSTTVPNDNQYVLCSSLSDGAPLVTFSGRTTFPINLSQIGILKNVPTQVTFNLNMLGLDENTINTGVAPLVTPYFANQTTCYISLSVNFFKYRQHK